jgi:hypothetical protein
MSPLMARRAGLIIVLVLASACAYGAWHLLKTSLRPAGIYTGLLLFALVLFLTLFSARKKIPFLPLLSASTWLQAHIYIGWFSVFIFLLHINFRIPAGPMEFTLAVIFCLVTASGAVGLFISRWLPPRMAQAGEPLIYERMPVHRRQISEGVENLIRHAEAETGSSTLGDFYFRRLRRLFDDRPGIAYVLADLETRRRRLTMEMNALNRYLSPREQEIASELHVWIGRKQNLDFQYAAQRLLKLWLFAHIGLTYMLILLGAVHGIVAGLYAGRL